MVTPPCGRSKLRGVWIRIASQRRACYMQRFCENAVGRRSGMSKSLVRRLFCLGGISVLNSVLAGCFIPVGYAYPTVAFVPYVETEDCHDEVHAFRVAVVDDQSGFDFVKDDRYVLSSIPLSSAGNVRPQMQLALD